MKRCVFPYQPNVDLLSGLLYVLKVINPSFAPQDTIERSFIKKTKILIKNYIDLIQIK